MLTCSTAYSTASMRPWSGFHPPALLREPPMLPFRMTSAGRKVTPTRYLNLTNREIP